MVLAQRSVADRAVHGRQGYGPGRARVGFPICAVVAWPLRMTRRLCAHSPGAGVVVDRLGAHVPAA
ncbi:hypothetical protein GCM10009733_096140 [Nonomuraea maheshkhaliensis]|uniref:Uncharacterized protein n=1 Tax=Nonomuraea maheshkhaliensis TaxID=419590 RepID=A0ABN2H9Z2_9ACTN